MSTVLDTGVADLTELPLAELRSTSESRVLDSVDRLVVRIEHTHQVVMENSQKKVG